MGLWGLLAPKQKQDHQVVFLPPNPAATLMREFDISANADPKTLAVALQIKTNTSKLAFVKQADELHQQLHHRRLIDKMLLSKLEQNAAFREPLLTPERIIVVGNVPQTANLSRQEQVKALQSGVIANNKGTKPASTEELVIGYAAYMTLLGKSILGFDRERDLHFTARTTDGALTVKRDSKTGKVLGLGESTITDNERDESIVFAARLI